MLKFWQEFTRTEKSNSVLRLYLKFYTTIPLSHTEYSDSIVSRKNGREANATLQNLSHTSYCETQ